MDRVIPFSKSWIPVYAEGDSEEWGDEPSHWTRRIMPYAAQAAAALQEHFTRPPGASATPVNTSTAQGPQWPAFPLDRPLTIEECALYRRIHAHGYRPVP